jgi:hypothetical protein
MKIDVVGVIWGSYLAQGSLATITEPTAATSYEAPPLIELVRDYPDETPRGAVEQWLAGHSGDFSEVTDFCVFSEGIEWEHEESGFFFSDCMFGEG